MRRSLIIIAALLCFGRAFANPVSKETAIQIARNFVKQETGIDAKEIAVVFSQKLQHYDHAAYYVCTLGEKGFVVVAGDDIAIPILAYSFDNAIGETIPSNVKGYLDELANEIDDALLQGISTKGENGGLSILKQSQNTYPSAVSPLLSTTWNQGTLYNEWCPLATSGTAPGRGSHVWAGCVATAMAQIIKHYEYPAYPRGYHEYHYEQEPDSVWDEDEPFVDFDNIAYDYSLMPDALSSSSSTASKYAVQELIYHCGVAVDMQYSDTLSSAYSFSVRSALVNYFKYNPQMTFAARNRYPDSVWMDMLKNELSRGRPIEYSGRGSGGHAFVCDGYMSTDLFHFNFGWGGSYDGYYSLSAINPGSGHDYSSNQYALIGITPDSTSRTYMAQIGGKSYYTVYDTIEAYDMHSTNTAQCGYFNHSHEMVFSPFDPTKHLVLEPILSPLRYVCVYDGEGYQIINAGYGGHSYSNRQFVTFNDITIKDTLLLSEYGFKIYIEDGHRMVSDLQATISNDTIHLSWHENGEAAAWQVEYGPMGFELGQGVRVNVVDTNMALTGLPYNEEYDIYVRSICSNNGFGPWSENVTVMIELPYELLCPGVENVRLDSTWDTGMRMVWDSGNVSEWQVEYGLSGFTLGTGTIVTVSSPEIMIDDLFLGRQYDVFIRKYCDNGHLGQRTQYSFRHKMNYPYWKDIVTSQPEGYQMGEDHNVYISSREGLAWLISTCNELNGASRLPWYTKKIVLMEDVDMSGYLWTPIDLNRNFDGRGHTISGLTISDDSLSKVGFAKSIYSDDTINNIIFKNCSICSGYSYANTGCIAGYNRGMIVNCGVSGVVASVASNTGGIVGENYGLLQNSYSVSNVYGQTYIGGSIGNSAYTHSLVSNCYSASEIASYNPNNFSNPYEGVFIGAANDTGHLAYWFLRDSTTNGCGNDVAGFSPFVMALGNDSYDTIWNLVSPTTIGGQYVTTLVDALNAWVDSVDTNGIYLHWAVDTAHINHGFPVFETTKYTLTVQSNDTNMGVVVGTGRYVENTAVIVSAIANNCHHFTGWSDGSTDNPRTVKMDKNVILTASFVANTPDTSNIYDTSCDYYTWNDGTYTVSGTYSLNTFTAQGCDSVATLNLTIHNSNIGIATEHACNSYTWIDGNTYIESTNTPKDTLQNIYGCDSIVTLHLTISDNVSVIETISACDSHTWNGVTYTSSTNTPSVTFTSIDGCDSTTTLHLTVNYSYLESDTVETCDRYEWHGAEYIASTNTSIHLQTEAGCDSGFVLLLTIHGSDNVTETRSECDEFVWNGVLLDESCDTIWTSTNIYDCDSIVTLHLVLRHSSSTVISETIVENQLPYSFNNSIFYDDTIGAIITLPNAVGCDSIISYSLSVYRNVETTLDSSICAGQLPFLWNGMIFTDAGTQETTYSDVHGADSVVQMTLHISSDYNDTIGVSICDNETYEFEDGVYTGSDAGYHTHILQTSVGCDSVRVLHLEVRNSTVGDTIASECDQFVWYGDTYTDTPLDFPMHTFTNISGCDSLVTLHLTINHSVTKYDSIAVASYMLPYDYNGITITDSGQYLRILETVDGCDSIIIIHAIINIVDIEPSDELYDLILFPNPTNGSIAISNAQEIQRVEIFDVTGRMTKIIDGLNVIDIQELPKGIFTLRIILPQGQTVRKIVKQ